MKSNTHSHELLLNRLFSRLRIGDIPFLVLHSYNNLPGEVESDVDIATSREGFEMFPTLIREGFNNKDWVVLHLWKHEICAYGCVLADPDNLSSTLLIDICSHYVARRRFIIRSEELLRDRVAYKTFFVPSPEMEAAYLMAKGVVKKKERSLVFLRLQELQSRFNGEISATCARVITGKQLSVTARNLEEIENAYEFLTLRDLGRPYNLLEHVADLGRIAERAAHPRGVHLAIISKDHDAALNFAEALEHRSAAHFLKVLVFDSHDKRSMNRILSRIMHHMAHVHLAMTIWPSTNAMNRIVAMTVSLNVDLDSEKNHDQVLADTELNIVRLLLLRFQKP